MRRPTTVRLYPLYREHPLPGLVDVVVFVLALAVWDSAGLPDTGWAVVPLLGVAALAHVLQMALLVNVRFDDEGLTITRLWRRRIAWAQVAGLVYTRMSATRGRDPYRLRLVLAGHEPPYGRYFTDLEKKQYARRCPTVMMVATVTPDPAAEGRQERREALCQERVLAELERHGLARPKPLDLAFRIRGQDPEQADQAIAADFLRRRDAARNAQPGEPF